MRLGSATKTQVRPAAAKRRAMSLPPTAAQPLLQTMAVENISSNDFAAIDRRLKRDRLKRAVDVAGSLGLLLILLPLLTLVVLAIACEGWPVLFRDTRVGRAGRKFNVLKFRTMVPDAESLLEQHLASNPTARDEWYRSFKLRDDPRVTRLGRFLRVSSIDELPQLFNVLRGDMSLVGPRPVSSHELDYNYQDDKYFYLQVRPGITGLWQVSGRNECSYQERVNLDVKYVQDWSLRWDLVILLQTVPAVVRRRGAY
jgi:undecaprenyl-phosphate galactose phosphotransferase